jgi:hypothetical protein
MKNKIVVVTRQCDGEQDVDEIDAEKVVLPGDAVIVLNRGLPPLHSREFAAWLSKWHATHNGAK